MRGRLVTIDEAIRILSQLINFIHGDAGYAEFENDLYSLLDALNEDKTSTNAERTLEDYRKSLEG